MGAAQRSRPANGQTAPRWRSRRRAGPALAAATRPTKPPSDPPCLPPAPPPSAIADALVFLIQSTAADLQLLPYGDWDGRSQDGDVPQKPMYGGLDAPKKVGASLV